MESETVGFGSQGGKLLLCGWYKAQGGFLHCKTGQNELGGGGLGTYHDRK